LAPQKNKTLDLLKFFFFDYKHRTVSVNVAFLSSLVLLTSVVHDRRNSRKMNKVFETVVKFKQV